MNAKAKQSSILSKDKLVLFSLLLALILVVILSNTHKSVQTIEPGIGPTEPPNVQGPSGPPPA